VNTVFETKPFDLWAELKQFLRHISSSNVVSVAEVQLKLLDTVSPVGGDLTSRGHGQHTGAATQGEFQNLQAGARLQNSPYLRERKMPAVVQS
jgi:hypothetical protein